MKELKLELFGVPYGLMALWNGAPDAAQYTVKLFVYRYKSKTAPNIGTTYTDEVLSKEPIAVVVTDRDTLYYTFTGLAEIQYVYRVSSSHGFSASSGACRYYNGMKYFIEVEAEDRNGKIIAKSDAVTANIKT